MTQPLELLTPAKINLFLHVTGRRPDGYHELDSIFLPVSIFDRVAIEASEANVSAVSIRCNWPHIPADDNNLAVRAARSFLEQTGLRWRVMIDLHKEIPAGAGLGGGSSDAGAVLRMLARLHGIKPQALAALALRLGADVPFFLNPQPARVGGVGEKMTYLDQGCRLFMIIGVPPVTVSTGEIYRHLERRQWSGPGPAAVPVPLETRAAQDLLVNDLESVAVARYPQIAEIKLLLQNLGASGALMSGSGGAVFALFPSAAQAASARQLAAARMPGTRFFGAQVVQDD